MSKKTWDVVVIGAGAAGSVFAHELTAAGLKVLLLEAGPRYDNHRDQFAENELAMWERVWDNSSYVVSGDGFTGAPNLGRGVGGGTLVWTSVSLRFFERDFRMRTLSGRPAGTTVEDWPLRLDEIEPYYEKAERQMGVSGAITPWDSPARQPLPNPAFGYYRSGVLLEGGMNRLGIRSAPGPVAVNSRRYRGRDQCLHCGFCRSGCRVDAKYQSDKVLLESAFKTGRLEVRSGAVATRIETAKTRAAVNTVVYYDTASATQRRVRAKVVIAANNPIEIPRLFLNSADERQPRGLGNHHDQVGRNFFCHPALVGLGVTSECVNSSVGYNMGNILTLDHCASRDPERYVGGFSLQSLNGAGAGVLAVDPYRNLWGSQLKEAMRSYNNSLFVIAFCEGMPSYDNRITVDASRMDAYGAPTAKIHYQLHANDRAVFANASAVSRDVLRASGSHSVFLTDTPFEAHPSGTMRMGLDERTSVTDSYGRVHGLTNVYVGGAALFVTGSSVNPTLTLHALALRTAKHLKENFQHLAGGMEG